MREAFSMIELIFVIVVMGILAAIAIPKLSLTRSDAQYVGIQSDIQTILSTIQTNNFTQDINPNNLNGDYIIETAGLSPIRWIATHNGVRLAKDGVIDIINNCVIFDFETDGSLKFYVDSTITSPLCKKLSKTYTKPILIPFDNASIKI